MMRRNNSLCNITCNTKITCIRLPNLSQWVTNRIKVFQKSIETSLEGFEEQITGLLLALEARRKKWMLDVASKRKMGKAEHKGHRELKSLLSSWGDENESKRNKSAGRNRAIIVHQ